MINKEVLLHDLYLLSSNYHKVIDKLSLLSYSKTMQERYKGFQKILQSISNAIIKVIGI